MSQTHPPEQPSSQPPSKGQIQSDAPAPGQSQPSPSLLGAAAPLGPSSSTISSRHTSSSLLPPSLGLDSTLSVVSPPVSARAQHNGTLSGLSPQEIFQGVEQLMRLDGQGQETRKSECSICMEDMLPGAPNVRTLPCNHSFHKKCIDVSNLVTPVTWNCPDKELRLL